MRHIMVDIESLGMRPGSVILSIGACEFSSAGVGATFYRAVDLFDSLVVRGLSIDAQTVAWWRAQPVETRSAVAPYSGRVTLSDALRDLHGFLKPGDYVWAKGPDFDLVLLAEAYHACGLTVPWSFRHTRDVRTIASLAIGARPSRGSLRHHALYDAIDQAETVLACYDALGLNISSVVGGS